jgi:LysM repeat protein
MTIALSVLLLIVVVAVLVLTQLDLGRDSSGRKKARVAAASTTVPTAPSTTTTTQPPRRTITYTVRSGDTLSGIARRFGVSTDAIVKANRITDPNHLTLGQNLKIPPAPIRRLTVQPAKVPLGGNVVLTLTGAPVGERITFQIQTPTSSFTGPPHVVAADGTVTTTYTPSGADVPGTYLLAAHGDQGTDVQAVLVVQSATG